MVMSCCAYGCSSTYKNRKEVSFHTFPKNEEQRKKWVIALRRKNFCPSASSRLCGLHFRAADYVVNFGQKKLTNNAVPSIFDFSEQIRKVECPSRSPRKRVKLLETEDRVTSSPTQEVDNFMQVIHSPSEGPTYTPESTPSTSNNNRRDKEKYLICRQKAKKMRRLAQFIINKKQKIKLLRTKTYRLQKQVKTLKALLTRLKNEEQISDIVTL